MGKNYWLLGEATSPSPLFLNVGPFSETSLPFSDTPWLDKAPFSYLSPIANVIEGFFSLLCMDKNMCIPLKRFLWVGAMNAECASNVMSLICNSWYASLLLSFFLNSFVFVFSHHFSAPVSFFCYFVYVKGIGNAPRLTGNSFHRKQTLSSIGSVSLCLYIKLYSSSITTILITKVDVPK